MGAVQVYRLVMHKRLNISTLSGIKKFARHVGVYTPCNAAILRLAEVTRLTMIHGTNNCNFHIVTAVILLQKYYHVSFGVLNRYLAEEAANRVIGNRLPSQGLEASRP